MLPKDIDDIISAAIAKVDPHGFDLSPERTEDLRMEVTAHAIHALTERGDEFPNARELAERVRVVFGQWWAQANATKATPSSLDRARRRMRFAELLGKHLVLRYPADAEPERVRADLATLDLEPLPADQRAFVQSFRDIVQAALDELDSPESEEGTSASERAPTPSSAIQSGRITVPGGWVYYLSAYQHAAMTFVPDPASPAHSPSPDTEADWADWMRTRRDSSVIVEAEGAGSMEYRVQSSGPAGLFLRAYDSDHEVSIIVKRY